MALSSARPTDPVDGLLRNAGMRIEKITLGADGQATGAERFDSD